MTRRLTGLGVAFETEIAGVAAAAHRLPRDVLLADASGAAPMEMQVLVGDQFGRIIGELSDADVSGVAWKLSDYGQARLTLPRETSSRRLLEFGNRLLIQFNNGLPVWAGTIDTPRDWRDGRIEVVGYSGEYLLRQRVTGRGRYFAKVTAGDIFRALLVEMEPIPGLEIGTVWIGGAEHSPEYHFRELYDIFTKSLTERIEAADWEVRGYLRGGRIVFRANYYERRGLDYGKRYAFIEGVNAVNVELKEQGDIVNEWFLAGAGTGWGENNRIYATARDAKSIGRYGLRQDGETRVDVELQSTLDASAAVNLATSKEPRPVVAFDVLDRPPARWSRWNVGDTLWLEVYSAEFGGYAAKVRVIAREFLPRDGVCSVVIE